MSAPTASTPGTKFASRPTGPAHLNPAAMVPPAAARASIMLPLPDGASARSLELQLIYETAPIGLARDRSWSVSQDLLSVADGDGTIVSVNPAWTETLGWSEDELLGKSGEWLVHPDDLAKSKNEQARLVEGRKTQLFENRIRHKGGT